MIFPQQASAQTEASEAAIALHLAANMPVATSLTETDLTLADTFIQWCTANGVRHCPATPATVAAFLLEQRKLDVVESRVVATVEAIETMHDYLSLPNPVATALVRNVLRFAVTIEPPRSWDKAEKISFGLLPSDIQAAITRREQDRDKYLRRRQNELADEIKRHKAS